MALWLLKAVTSVRPEGMSRSWLGAEVGVGSRAGGVGA